MFRRRPVNNFNESSRVAHPPNAAARLNGSAGGTAAQHHDSSNRMSVVGVLLDYSFMLFLVIGGCCSYVSTSLQHTQVFHRKAL